MRAEDFPQIVKYYISINYCYDCYLNIKYAWSFCSKIIGVENKKQALLKMLAKVLLAACCAGIACAYTPGYVSDISQRVAG
jgi:hypothetical protein